MEKVSVIMPCYNDGAFIEESVASVRGQTYSNTELIIIDDGSDDAHTLKILEQFKRDGVTVLHTDHLRPAGARNAGIRAATGKYILPLDSDDTIEPAYIEQAVAVMEKNEAIGAVYCHADLFGKASGPWQLKEYSLENMLVDNVVFVTALFRREDWQAVGGFRTTMERGLEDYDFWLSILELGRNIYQLPDTLFHYRIKSGSRTSQFMENPQVIKDTYREIYHNHPALYDRYREEYVTALRNELVDQICINRTYQTAIGFLSKIKSIPLIRWIARKVVLK